jgi:heterodisulfide reductase subunit C
MTQLGLKEKVLENASLWLCASCFTCTDRCPKGLEVASIIRVLKNLATEKGIIPDVYKEILSNILETGYAYKIRPFRIKKRQNVGLPSLPKGNSDSIKKTVRGTKILKLIKSEEENNERN